jgi:hypothetical protein
MAPAVQSSIVVAGMRGRDAWRIVREENWTRTVMTAPSMNNRMRCLGYLSANVSRKIRKHFVSGAGIIR